MKNDSLKKAINRGFTLVELMIVIVILGILVVSFVPKLIGAQGRARDLARINDLTTISNALEMYYDDYGNYPGTNGTKECLNPASTTATDTVVLISDYIDSVPKPVLSTQVSAGCTGQYAYIPLTSRGLNNNAYALITDVETYQKANAVIASPLTTSATALTGVAAGIDNFKSSYLKSAIADLKTADTASAITTTYIVTR